MLRIFPLLLLPLNVFAQLFTGQFPYSTCVNAEYSILIQPDSGLIVTQRLKQFKLPKKDPRNCFDLTHVFLYAYGKLDHVSDTIYHFEISGNAVLDLELKGRDENYFERKFGNDTMVITFDSIKPDRIQMRSINTFKVRYENGKDTVYHYSDLTRMLNEINTGSTYYEFYNQDTSSYSRFCRAYSFRYNHSYYGPGQKIYIDIGLTDPVTGKNFEFEIPYGRSPYFSWNVGEGLIIKQANELYITKKGCRIYDSNVLKRKN